MLEINKAKKDLVTKNCHDYVGLYSSGENAVHNGNKGRKKAKTRNLFIEKAAVTFQIGAVIE